MVIDVVYGVVALVAGWYSNLKSSMFEATSTTLPL